MYRIGNAQVWVHDQDEALEFYTKGLGMEVRSDVTMPEMGGFRWLTVGPPGQDDFGIVLMAVPGPLVFDAETSGQAPYPARQGRDQHGVPGEDDCQKAYEELAGRGVEFQEPPEQRPYGIDAGFRDPSGNNFRLTEVTEQA